MAQILIVDDDPDIVKDSRLLLEAEGHKIFAARNRTDGLKQALAIKPDLIILDVMLQEADDGIILAQELRRAGYTAPILLLTAISRITRHSYGPHNDLLPVNGCLEKPTHPETLIKTIQQLLATREKTSDAKPQS